MSTTPDPEPTPEFLARCDEIFGKWEDGDLPFKEAIDQLAALGREAALTSHLANQGRAELLLGIVQGYRANLDTSISHFERALSLFERAGNRRRATGCALNLGESYRLKGYFSRARQLFHSAFDHAQELGAVDMQTIAATNEGQLLLSMGQLENARATLEKAYALAGQVTERPDQRAQLLCESQSFLALVHLRLKEYDRAWSYIFRAVETSREIDQPLYLGIAYRALGEIVSTIGALPPDADPALSRNPDDYFQMSSDAFQSIKAEGEQARTMYAHALSLAARGQNATAARKLQQAMLIFNRLGMTDDAAKAAHARMEALANPKTGS